MELLTCETMRGRAHAVLPHSLAIPLPLVLMRMFTWLHRAVDSACYW